MTIPPEKIAEYEARAAKGENPKLPWAHVESQSTGSPRGISVYSHPEATNVAVFFEVDGVAPFAVGACAAYLAADDALLAFAAPLLDAPVEGPWRAQQWGDGGLWFVTDQEGPWYNDSDNLYFPDQAEAEAIARVRNEAWQRRQKESKP